MHETQQGREVVVATTRQNELLDDVEGLLSTCTVGHHVVNAPCASALPKHTYKRHEQNVSVACIQKLPLCTYVSLNLEPV